MLGLSNSISSSSYVEPYKELSELNNYSDLDVHFDFSTLGSANGAEISAVTNLGQASSKSINSNSGTPLFDQSTMGRPSIAFDGTDEILNMEGTFTSTNKAFTIFIVFRLADLSADFVLTGATDASSTPEDYVKFQGTDGNKVFLAIGGETVVNVQSDSTAGSTINYSQVADVNTVYVIRRNTDGEVFIYADKGLFISTKTSTAMKAGATFELAHIGGTTETGSGSSLADLTGNIGEVGIYDADIGASDAITLAEELSKKWGVTRSS